MDDDLEMGTSSSSSGPGDQSEAGELSHASIALEICEEQDSGILDLPRKHYPRAVPNVCAICLEAYKTDETVVWSSNIDCSHAFHQDCIFDYLIIKLKVKDTLPCPCCRQDFMGLSSEEAAGKSASDTEELNVFATGDTAHMASENM
jgi:hypothetical protein